jgi:hypothetical protein
MRRFGAVVFVAMLVPQIVSAQRTVPARGTASCTLTSVSANAGAPRTATRAVGIPSTATRASTTGQPVPAGEYDIVLDVPNLCVDSIRLVVQNLNAHLALDARVANLARITAGADVKIQEVDLSIRDVRAEALLLVDLDNVRFIVEDLLTMIDNNPEIINTLVGTLGSTVGTLGSVANTALQPGGVVSQAVGTVGQTLNNLTQPGGVLTQTVNTLGQTVQKTLGTTGNILEKTLDTTGRVVNERTLGNLLSLPALRETTNAAGQLVKTVRDTGGTLIEYTLDSAGKILGARVVQ